MFRRRAREKVYGAHAYNFVNAATNLNLQIILGTEIIIKEYHGIKLLIYDMKI